MFSSLCVELTCSCFCFCDE